MPHSLFTAEHEMLRRSIRAFVEKEITPYVAAWEDAGQIPRELWRRLGELGFLGLEFPTEYGGGGAPLFSGVVLRGGEGRGPCGGGAVCGVVPPHTSLPWVPRPRP